MRVNNKMNSTFKQFNKLKIPLIKDINQVFDNKHNELKADNYNKLAVYQCCVVGSIRERLGLDIHYEYEYKYHFEKDELARYKANPNYCSKCRSLADHMPQPIRDYIDEKSYLNEASLNWMEKWDIEKRLKEYKEQYEGLLLEFKQHLALDHKVKLSNGA